MNEKNMQVAKPVLVAAVLATIVWVSAGSLTPPAGPIAPTQRIPVGDGTTPGDALSVFKIIQPGSYYLTGNVKGIVGKHGIEIDASHVTLDLMGFEVAGVVGSLAGIHVTNVWTNIAVFNGSVRDWGQDGVLLFSTINSRVADLRVSGNGAHGIVAGANAVVTGCVINQNGVSGVQILANSVVTDCASSQNGGRGISTGEASVVTNSTAYANGSEGIYALSGSTVTSCSARSNGTTGIVMGSGSTVADCTAASNGTDGIRIIGSTLARGNNSYANGGASAGILVQNADNRIEGNNCTDNGRGIDVDLAGNFITRNTCSGNATNWDVVAGNVCLVVNATLSAAILGNSGGVAPGSTDPNANFSY